MVVATPRNIQVRTLEVREGTILVVDDESAGRDLMHTLLTTQGYRVKVACDGFAALELVEAGGIDLVLLDLMMSRLDGVEVCAHIRKSAKHAFLPVVFTTSLHDRASRIRAKEAGADDFLVKPIDGLELLVRIERLLRLRAHSELVLADRDRLLKELTRVRSSLSTLSEPLPGQPTVTHDSEQLIREQRRLINGVLRSETCAQNDVLRIRLEEILRMADELERRVTAPSTAFPLSQTRSTV